LRFIHAVLGHAATRGMNILPVPIRATNGATFASHAGHLWELAPWLPGVADYERSPRVEKLRAAMRALAQFHLAVARSPASPPLVPSRAIAQAITQRLNCLLELERGGIDTLANAISDEIWPDLAPLAREVTAELPRVVPIAIARLAPLANEPLPLQPCIRDVWHDHILFTGDVVTGLIDFGAMQIDTPATDIARLLGSLVGDDAADWQNGLAAYSAVRPLSENESSAVAALDAAGTILAGCNWIRWIYVEGRSFDNPQQIIERVARLVSRLHSIPTSGS
jgi:Ser/Thr protein kinase RdoA (MazF antagonist)